MNKQTIITFLLALVAMSGLGQTEGSQRERQNWAAGGVLMLLAPEPDYYDKKLERYNPPVPMVWFGPAWLNDDQHEKFHFRSGVFNKIDCGFTILQISRNLYRGVIGVSASLQFGGSIYTTSRNYSFEKDGHRVEFVPADDEHKKNHLSFAMLRIPLLIGAQTNNRLFSLQTGVGLYQTSRTGAQWLITAGVGPVTLNYSRHLTSLFKLSDGTKAYPSSFTIGVDVWYWLCRFTHRKKDGAID